MYHCSGGSTQALWRITWQSNVSNLVCTFECWLSRLQDIISNNPTLISQERRGRGSAEDWTWRDCDGMLLLFHLEKFSFQINLSKYAIFRWGCRHILMVAASTGSLPLMDMTLGLAFSLNGSILKIRRWVKLSKTASFLSSSGDCAHLWQWGWIGGVYNRRGEGGRRRRGPRDASWTQWVGCWDWTSNLLHNSHLQVQLDYWYYVYDHILFQEGLSWGGLCRFAHLPKTRSLPTQVWQLLFSLEIKDPLLQGLLHQIIWVRYYNQKPVKGGRKQSRR